MTTKIRYVCRACGSKWSRKVQSRSFQPLDRPISAVCPGCTEDREKSQDPQPAADK